VLVVDDDPLIRQMVCTTLERAGYRVQAAGDGVAALEAYTAETGDAFGLVLADVVMPRMNGVDLAYRLRQCDADVPLLFMSGRGVPDLPAESFPNRAVNLLQKPFRAEGLLRAVRAALDRGPRRPPTASAAPGPRP
jgi:DNA-binding response OmpR family regulator